MKIKLLLAITILLCGTTIVSAQTTFPVNDVADARTGYYAFTNATIVKDGKTTLDNATMVVKDGKIQAIGKIAAPEDAVVIDCKGRFIYPSFIDMFSDYRYLREHREALTFLDRNNLPAIPKDP
ncbi:MAG TPA: hypothetical protein PK110_14565 [Niabella sp.]|nr:hypothetical protein [Niabella sp.]